MKNLSEEGRVKNLREEGRVKNLREERRGKNLREERREKREEGRGKREESISLLVYLLFDSSLFVLPSSLKLLFISYSSIQVRR